MIELLQKLGFRKNESKVLSVLMDGEWHTSREIEHTADMRQPEVSIALKGLVAYVEFDEINNGKSGAPIKPVRLEFGKESLIEFLTDDIASEYSDKLNMLKELRDMTTADPPHDRGT